MRSLARTLVVPGSAAAGGAPTDAQYVTLATNGTLTQERVLTGTSNQIVVSDNGAGSTVVLSTPQDIHTGASPTFVALTLTGLTDGGVLFSASDVLTQDTSNFFWDNANDRLGLRAASAPSTVLHVNTSTMESFTDAAALATNIGGLFAASVTETGTTVLRGVHSEISYNPASNPASSKVLTALNGLLAIPGANAQTLSNVSFRAINSTAQHLGTGTILDCWGGNYRSVNSSTGTITNGVPVRAVVSNGNASGVITTAKHFEVAALTNSGTIGDTYGYYCGDITTGTQTNQAWAFYNADTNARNYFGGTKNGFGSATTPLSALHIEGASGWFLQDEQDTDPTTTELDSLDSVALYSKSNKFVIAYNNGGTITYITIPFDGATTAWTHSTTAP